MKDQLSKLLKQKTTVDLSTKLHRHACVAIILRGETLEQLEVGFIQRAFNIEDRWSGQLAFPGGKREEFDLTDLDVAIRETKEEVGIELEDHHLVGRIDDNQARKAGLMLDFYIRPFVFYFPDTAYSLILDANEVADFFWIPLAELSNPLRQTTYTIEHESQTRELPAVFLDREPPLWGLTYMMCLDLLSRLYTPA